MIDAVRCGVRVHDPERVAARLFAQPFDPTDGRSVRGNVGTLRATLRYDTLWFRGSLPTFLGETAPLSQAGVERARARIEDAFGFSIEDAQVTSVEITADLLLSRPVALYLPLLRSRSRAQRREYEGESVAFVTETRSHKFYDKAAERVARGHPPPCGHVLRAELKYVKRLRRQLRTAGPVTFPDLHDARFMRLLICRWETEWDRIRKRRQPVAFDGAAPLEASLALAGLHAIGPHAVETHVRSAMQSKRLNRKTGSDRLRRLRALAADPAFTTESPLLTELDGAIRKAAVDALDATCG